MGPFVCDPACLYNHLPFPTAPSFHGVSLPGRSCPPLDSSYRVDGIPVLPSALPPSTEAILPMPSTEAPPYTRSGVGVVATPLQWLPDYRYDGVEGCSAWTGEADCVLGFSDPLSTSGSSAPSYSVEFPAFSRDNGEQRNLELNGPLPFPSTAEPLYASARHAHLPWSYDGALFDVPNRPLPFAHSEQLTVDALGCDITLWDTFDLQAVFNGDRQASATSVSSANLFSPTPTEGAISADSCVGPAAPPARQECNFHAVDASSSDLGLPDVSLPTPVRGTKRRRASIDEDSSGERKRRFQSSSAFVGFPVTDP